MKIKMLLLAMTLVMPFHIATADIASDIKENKSIEDVIANALSIAGDSDEAKDAAVQAAVSALIAAKPDSAADILTSAIKKSPKSAAAIVTIAVKAAPTAKAAAAITTLAVKAAPDQAALITSAAVQAQPTAAAAITTAAIQAAPASAVAITESAVAAAPLSASTAIETAATNAAPPSEKSKIAAAVKKGTVANINKQQATAAGPTPSPVAVYVPPVVTPTVVLQPLVLNDQNVIVASPS